MKITTWNVNGIRAIHKKGFMDYLQQEQPDILCLQEVRAEIEQIDADKISPMGYNTFYFPAQSKKGYSGVAIYSKEKPTNVVHGFGNERFDREGRVLQAEFGNTVFLSVYFPKAYSEKEANGDAKKLERLSFKMDFYDALLQHCEDLKKQGKEVIISGDYNTAHTEIDLARPKENTQTSGFLEIERKKLDWMVDNNYHDVLRQFVKENGHYSWWSQRGGARERNVGWRIDYHFITSGLLAGLKNAYHQPLALGSDHCPVVMELAL